jgi:hypothetical protein
MEKTTGPSAVARLGNPVAHPSGAEGGAACAVRGVLVRVLGRRRGRRRLGAAVIKINAYALSAWLFRAKESSNIFYKRIPGT